MSVAFVTSLGIMFVLLFFGATLGQPGLFMAPLWFLMAGGAAVRLYRRLTGLRLSVRAGARLGSLTGVLVFVGFLILAVIDATSSGEDIVQTMKQQNPQAAQMLDSTSAVVFMLLFSFAVIFAMIVGICAAGGALGARLANRNAS